MVGSNFYQGKNDFKSGGIFEGLFLARTKEYCLTIIECGFIEEHKISQSFNDTKRVLDRTQYFKKRESEKISAILPRSWKKSFITGVVIPAKMRSCNECNDKKMSDRCNKQVNENKNFEPNLNLLETQAPSLFSRMLPFKNDNLLDVCFFENDSVYDIRLCDHQCICTQCYQIKSKIHISKCVVCKA